MIRHSYTKVHAYTIEFQQNLWKFFIQHQLLHTQFNFIRKLSVTWISDEIVKETGNANVVVHHVDLSSFKSVREFASVIEQNEAKIDVLIHNAGYVDYLRRATSVDGIELTMATNHYGPFLLTHLLIDVLKRSAPCRVVIVASKTHTLSFLNPFKDYHLNPVGFLLPMFLYGNSKYANILTTFEMAKRLKSFKITVNCLHPGKNRPRRRRKISKFRAQILSFDNSKI